MHSLCTCAARCLEEGGECSWPWTSLTQVLPACLYPEFCYCYCYMVLIQGARIQPMACACIVSSYHPLPMYDPQPGCCLVGATETEAFLPLSLHLWAWQQLAPHHSGAHATAMVTLHRSHFRHRGASPHINAMVYAHAELALPPVTRCEVTSAKVVFINTVIPWNVLPPPTCPAASPWWQMQPRVTHMVPLAAHCLSCLPSLAAVAALPAVLEVVRDSLSGEGGAYDGAWPCVKGETEAGSPPAADGSGCGCSNRRCLSSRGRHRRQPFWDAVAA